MRAQRDGGGLEDDGNSPHGCLSEMSYTTQYVRAAAAEALSRQFNSYQVTFYRGLVANHLHSILHRFLPRHHPQLRENHRFVLSVHTKTARAILMKSSIRTECNISGGEGLAARDRIDVG